MLAMLLVDLCLRLGAATFIVAAKGGNCLAVSETGVACQIGLASSNPCKFTGIYD